MTGQTDEKLVHMANQIARNLSLDEDPPAAVAEHMRAFWNPRMIEALMNQPDAALDPVVAQAVRQLAVRAEVAGG